MSEPKSVRYTIPGKPKGKSRPRFGKGSVYTDEKTKDYERLSKALYKKASKGITFPQGTPVRVDITACFPVPSKANKKLRQEMESGARLPMLRPDTDNIAKIILDSLNKTAYLDDAQVVETHVQKKYSKEPCVTVTVEEIKESK
ncbi:MAG: RusA family crossover junction endodeoxyribonuclease [Oscillospiraceae bacterium]|nr:RusA family crossover junction endodeoxyribonuclease [Oscillospiraceae bacterium]